MYKSIYEYGEDEFIVKKSRFIGYAKPCETEADAIAFIDEIKKKHYDATHNCSAYIIGENSNIQRFNDDGEPSGTAGIPMIEVLKKEGLTNLCVVATRYFGGVMLGAGGLVRAYSKSCKIAIDNGIVVDMELFYDAKFKYDYSYHGKIMNYLDSKNVKIGNIDYQDFVYLNIKVYNSIFESVVADLDNITSAEIELVDKNEIILATRDGELMEGKND